VIGFALFFGNGCLLEELCHLGIFPSAIMMAAGVGEKEVVGVALSAPLSLLVSLSMGLFAVGG
jgi:hypothetical protein